MMPPKKSKAARSVNQEEIGEPSTKRQRNIPVSEQVLTEWVETHLEESIGHELVLTDAYESYVQSCVSANTVAVAQSEFLKVVKDKFPKGIAVKSSSPFAALVRVKKAKNTKNKTNTLKLKDVVVKAIEDLGNPLKGIRFFVLNQYIARKYPSFGLTMRSKFLLTTIEKCIQYGQLDLVRGVGMCGLYRVVGPPKQPSEEDKENHEENVPSVGEENGKEHKPMEKQENEESEKQESEQEQNQKTRKGKLSAQRKSKKNKKAVRRTRKSVIIHSDPQKIEDAFMLAMTFMVEPKEASVKKILKYITEYYDKDLSVDRLRKCLERGFDKGYWQQVTGQGLSGTIRLLMDSCDPKADEDLTGQVTNALIACTEPKYCSANLLKSYLIEYHPHFDLQNKPHLFKKALERGIKKQIIRQLRGLGATGSFQLSKRFTPSPAILRGEDTVNDYYVSDEEDAIFSQFDISTFQNAYQPRPTKSRGHGRQASRGISSDPVPLASLVYKSNRMRSASGSLQDSRNKQRSQRSRKQEQHPVSEQSAKKYIGRSEQAAAKSAKRKSGVVEFDNSQQSKKKKSKSGRRSGSVSHQQLDDVDVAASEAKSHSLKKVPSKSAKKASKKKSSKRSQPSPKKAFIEIHKEENDYDEDEPIKPSSSLKSATKKESDRKSLQATSQLALRKTPTVSYREDSEDGEWQDVANKKEASRKIKRSGSKVRRSLYAAEESMQRETAFTHSGTGGRANKSIISYAEDSTSEEEEI